MDVVFIYNGLGNQMSQYALYLRKKEEGKQVRFVCYSSGHNGIEINRLFGVPTNKSFFDRILLLLYYIMKTPKIPIVFRPIQYIFSIIGVHFIKENNHYDYKEDIVFGRETGLSLYAGGWHHWKYIETIKDNIRNTYIFPPFSNMKNVAIEKETTSENAVAVHIRRGDYMTKELYEIYGAVCDETYYRNAIRKVEETIDKPVYYVFSNDFEWSQKLLNGKSVVFVDWNRGTDSWQDMALMSKFKNIIIANSTFSWWAAWLGPNNKEVICPPYLVNKDLTSDIFPENWTRIQS